MSNSYDEIDFFQEPSRWSGSGDLKKTPTSVASKILPAHRKMTQGHL